MGDIFIFRISVIYFRAVKRQCHWDNIYCRNEPLNERKCINYESFNILKSRKHEKIFYLTEITNPLPEGSMLHSKGLYNNCYQEPNQLNSSYWYLYFFMINSNIFIPSNPRPCRTLIAQRLFITFAVYRGFKRINAWANLFCN